MIRLEGPILMMNLIITMIVRVLQVHTHNIEYQHTSYLILVTISINHRKK